MARMAMMGRHSVTYHAQTLGVGADQAGLDPQVAAAPSAALRYYSSHGETPLEWGGAGAEALGLVGMVTTAQYEALFAEGGAADPTTGARLVRTARPGMEIVVSAQKSVAELGVIGRVSDMHAILEAETAATMAYLDWVTRTAGGRRGRGGESCPTAGMIYLRTRHATSRAGDPSPHDHVLVANVVEMRDDRGGWKAPDTTVWRDHLHAATMVGRMASAAKAIELGYGIGADPGPSGRLGHWRIAGVPRAVEERHSKRAAEIEEALSESGFVSPRAREIASAQTRPRKRHTPIEDLMGRWHAELTEAGYAPAELSRMVDAAGREHRVAPLHLDQLRSLIDTALSPEGTLGRRKVFTRADVIVALAPALYGQAPEILDAAVSRLVADPEVIPLVRVAGARQRAYSTAATLATEAAIADGIAAAMARTDAPVVAAEVVAAATARAEAALGGALTPGQAELVRAATSSGRGAELVVGIAGSGKTAALSVITDAFETSGFTVIGTATSGQAARTLGTEAGIGLSRTLASINWRLDHQTLVLSERHVVILDEVGTTDDPALLRLLYATEAAGAKVVLVGDWRQLGPVGPGGAFEALLRRHRDVVVVLADNVRQRDPAEARALSALRSGSVPDAVDFYAERGRLVPATTRSEAIEAAVVAWAEDRSQGRDALLLAWRRANVAALNARAREAMEAVGCLSGPELVVGSRRYRQGERVVALAPLAQGEARTSTRAVVTEVDPAGAAVALRTDDGRGVVVVGEDLSRIDYGYATTVHRAQGATTDRAHLLADGGGRELAYVGMSRAREASVAYVVADDLDQAREDLVAEWSSLRRPRWVIDTSTPEPAGDIGPAAPDAPSPGRLALRAAYLRAQLSALRAAAPRDLSAELDAAAKALSDLEAERGELLAGRGRYREITGPAVAELEAHRYEPGRIRHQLEAGGPGLFERRRLRAELARADSGFVAAQAGYETAVAPHRVRIEADTATSQARLADLKADSLADANWLAEHPEASRRVTDLTNELRQVGRAIENRRRALARREPVTPTHREPLSAAQRMQRRLAQEPARTAEPPTPSLHRGLSL